MNYNYVYNTSKVRNNCITWLDFRESDSVLLLGNGCESYGRALSVIVAQVDYCCKDVYDWIILCDVNLESSLPNVKNHCKKDGTIVILADNALGVSYLNGLIPPNENDFFATVNNAKKDLKGNYYTINEIEGILKKNGLLNYKTYYPYPNKDFTYSIYSDERMPQQGELHIQDYPYKKYRMNLFSEQALYDRLLERNLYKEFANSYMVIVGKNKIKELYVKFSNERKEAYNIVTTIERVNNEIFVAKKACSESSEKHIENIYNIYHRLIEVFKNSDFIPNRCECIDKKLNEIRFEYVQGTNLDTIMDGLLADGNKEEFFRLFKKYLKNIRSAYPMETARDIDIDLIFQNIIVSDDVWYVIDYEWTLKDELPVDFVIHRAIHYYYYQSQCCRNVFTKIEELYDFAGINPDKITDYLEIEKEYQNRINSERTLFEDIDNDGNIRLADLCLYVQVEYYDENDKCTVQNITVPIVNGRVYFDIEIPNGTNKVKVLSADDNMLVKIKVNDGLKVNTNATVLCDGIYFFDEKQFMFDVQSEGLDNINVVLDIISRNMRGSAMVLSDISRMITENAWLNKVADERMEVIEDLQHQLRTIYNSKIWRVVGKFIK